MRATLAIGLAIACRADADGDGLTNKEEEALGTDPNRADTDADGLDDGDEGRFAADPLDPDTDDDALLDGAEVAAGSDPRLVDTDGDGYTDRDEVYEGRDPANPNSLIYVGGWPYLFDKDSLEGGKRANAAVGERFRRLQMLDQFGDEVDLFDFYNADKPVVIAISAGWDGASNALALYLEGEPDNFGYSLIWSEGSAAIKQQKVHWLTILVEDPGRDPARKPDVTEWWQEYNIDEIPVLADTDAEASDFVSLVSWPTVVLLEPTLEIAEDVPEWTAEAVLIALSERFP